jgi:hypothetical protein
MAKKYNQNVNDEEEDSLSDYMDENAEPEEIEENF